MEAGVRLFFGSVVIDLLLNKVVDDTGSAPGGCLGRFLLEYKSGQAPSAAAFLKTEIGKTQ